MKRTLLKTSLLALAATVLATLPAAAQVIPRGSDRWVTPPDGQTGFTFPKGEVESLCGAEWSKDWDRRVALRGVPFPGADWDTSVARLGDVDLDCGLAKVPIQVEYLHFQSISPQWTPCGQIHWDVHLFDRQPITWMLIEREEAWEGGWFEADLEVRVAFDAYTVDGDFLGTLIYTVVLPDPGGTPWQLGGPTGWQPGITQDETCFDVLRRKAARKGGDHVYYIEDMIAEGRCEKRPNA